MNIEALCKNAAQILEGFLDFVLKEEVMIQDYDLKIAEMVGEIFNKDSEMCVMNLKEFMNEWKKTYTEDHPLNEQFKKIISKILRKSQGKIDNQEHAKWFNELFIDNISGGAYMVGGGGGYNGDDDNSGEYNQMDEAIPIVAED